jgi:hypothetical protein
MSRPSCALCIAPAQHRHHWTGRRPDGRYWDPDLWSWLCRSCHARLHRVLRAAGLERVPNLTVRARRFALHATLFAAHGDTVLFVPLMLRAVASIANDTADLIDETRP